MNIESFARLSLSQLQTAFQTQELSPVDVIDMNFAQIEATHSQINALYGIRYKETRREAKASEKRYKNNCPISPFDGVPVTIKDSVNATGMSWYHGSAIHGNGIISKTDSPPVKRLKEAGAIILGKGIMPDFGLSASGVSSSHGIVRNPWGLDWNTGGSSAGGGASLAAGIGMMSVGSDIAGSVRLPASHCGLAAFKPTQGVIAHAPASTVRSAGPMVRQAVDLDAWTRLLSGPDDADRFSLAYADNEVETSQLNVGFTTDFGFGPSVEPEVLACIENAKNILEDIVGNVQKIEKQAHFDAYLAIDESLKIKGWLEHSGAKQELRCQTPEQLYDWFHEAEHWTPNKIREIDAGLEKAIAYCVDLLSDVDFLLTPVMPIVNFPADKRGIDDNMPLRHTTFTALFNQSGNPAVSICGGFDTRGLPIGIQLVGKRHQDCQLIKLAAQLEKELDLFGVGKHTWPTKFS